MDDDSSTDSPFVRDDVDTRPGGGGPDSVAGYINQEITQAIINGRLEPGTKLSPHHLAREFKVSHIPVREALAALEAVGHVRRVNRQGSFVTEMSAEDIRDIHRWRTALETEAHRIGVPLLTDADLSSQRTLYESMAHSVKKNNPSDFAAANREFHFIPFQKVGSERLLRFLCNLWDSSVRYHSLRLHTKGEMQIIQDQHEQLLDAFYRRDPDLVNRLSLEHTTLTLTLMEHALKSTNDERAVGVSEP